MEQPPNEEHRAEPGPTELVTMLLSLEAELHGQGWDQPAQVFALHTLQGSAVSLMPLMSHETQMSCGHPATFMDALTHQLHAADAPQPPTTDHGVFFGLVVVHEAWGRFGAAAATADPTKPLADQVGSVECRMIYLSTVRGTELLLWRIRGQQPVVMPSALFVGQIPESMRLLVAAMDG